MTAECLTHHCKFLAEPVTSVETHNIQNFQTTGAAFERFNTGDRFKR